MAESKVEALKLIHQQTIKEYSDEYFISIKHLNDLKAREYPYGLVLENIEEFDIINGQTISTKGDT